jgi:hypothetical protein
VDNEGNTALWLATHMGHPSVVETLARIGLDLEARDQDGYTVLMYAAQCASHAREVNALIAGGAILDSQHLDSGFNALAYALAKSNCEGAVALMKAGSSLSKVVETADGDALLSVKNGLDALVSSIYSEGHRDVVQMRLHEVVEKLEKLKLAGGPAVVLKPWQKQKVTDLAQKAKENLKLEAKEKRPQYRSKRVAFAPVRTLETEADDGLSSQSDTSSDSENSSASNTKLQSPEVPLQDGEQQHAAQQEQVQGEEPTLDDALSYVERVKAQFDTQPDVYKKFLDILRDWQAGNTDVPGVTGKISTLFSGDPELVRGFPTFLPEGYHIELITNNDLDDTIRVTPPLGSSIDVMPQQPSSEQES